jgi:catabolite regulation protein CreA
VGVKEFVQYQLDDGSVVIAEVDVPEVEQGTARVSRRRDGVIQQSAQRFEEAAIVARQAAVALLTDLRDMTEQPSQVTVSFGLKLSLSMGAVIASSSAEGNFEVTLTWDRGAGNGEPG